MNLASLNTQFTQYFQRSASAAFFAPGRVNLMGEHTDYNQGLVLAAAINLGSYLLVAPRDDQQMNLVAESFIEEPRQWLSSALIPQDNEFDWSNYLRSLNENIVMQFGAIKGMDVLITSDLPIGSGLSSSFSVLIAFAEAVNQLNGLGLNPLAIAQLCLHTKHQLSSPVAQLSEPLTIAAGVEQHALLIDCRTDNIKIVPLPGESALLIVDPKEPKGFVASAFLQRKSQCETAAKAFGLSSLRDLTKADLLAAQHTLDDVVFRRALHVVTENNRCVKLAAHLQKNEIEEASEVLADSQRSLREDLDVTTATIDYIADALIALLGSDGGVHLTGGGFGGSLLVLVRKAKIEAVKLKIAELFANTEQPVPEVIEVTAAAGVRRLALL